MPCLRWVTLAGCLLVLGSASGCGADPHGSTPRACAVLGDDDIQVATHELPSSVGGGDAGDHSTCVWALPNQAGGSVTALLVSCPAAADCAAPLASLAPSDRFIAVTGLPVPARISNRPDLRDGIVIVGRTSLLQLQVDHLDVDSRAALTELARRAGSRL